MHDLNHDIEKYRKGELSPAEMHLLEKKALSDPFLAEGLEGIESISHEQFSDDLTNLNQRLSKKKETIFTPLRIAAAVFILLTSSFILYFVSNTVTEEKNLAQSENKSASQTGPDTQADSTKGEGLLTLKESEKEPLKNKQDKTTQPPKQIASRKPVETETSGTASGGSQALEVEGEKSQTEMVQPKTEDDLKTSAPVTEPEQKKEDQKVAAAQSSSELRESATSKSLSRSKTVTSPSSSSDAFDSQFTQSVQGQVTSALDGSPMPGVNVVLKGTTTGTITDDQGNYVIELPATENASLVFSFIGAHTDEVPVKSQSILNVALKDDVSQLSEVVVVGYGSEDDDLVKEPVTPTLLLAEPTGGRRSFKKYLETNLQYPRQALENKIEGRVTIQFTVKTDGGLDDFRVIKGLGYGCENEVIRLVKSGPKWSPSLKGEKAIESRMRVRMKFNLPD
jgi:TonB family protein